MKDKDIVVTDVTGTEAFKLVQEGQRLVCPKCGAVIKTIPENWSAGMPLYGIECSKEQGHFLIHYEDEKAMKEMRARMKERINKKS